MIPYPLQPRGTDLGTLVVLFQWTTSHPYHTRGIVLPVPWHIWYVHVPWSVWYVHIPYILPTKIFVMKNSTSWDLGVGGWWGSISQSVERQMMDWRSGYFTTVAPPVKNNVQLWCKIIIMSRGWWVWAEQLFWTCTDDADKKEREKVKKEKKESSLHSTNEPKRFLIRLQISEYKFPENRTCSRKRESC